MACNYYYYDNAASSQVVDKNWVAAYGGINPDTSTPAELAAAGFYCYVDTTPPTYDPNLYYLNSTWVITGTNASEDYTVVELPLASAQANSVAYEKQQTATQTATVRASSGYCQDILDATASRAEIDRDPTIQATLTAQNAFVDRMVSNIAAINAATSISEIADIIDAPTGVLNTGRGGPGQAGPEDLNLSFLKSLALPYAASQLELYVPSTTTVLPYNASLPSPYEFDSAGNCFLPGDYSLQVRLAGSSIVIASLDVPEGANVDVPFY